MSYEEKRELICVVLINVELGSDVI